MNRIFDRKHIWRLEPAMFGQAITLLADQLGSFPIDTVIGIERGGRFLAQALAARLDLPVLTILARHNRSDAIRQQATGYVQVNTAAAAQVSPGSTLLLCDDICGTGATLRAVSGALDSLVCPREIRTVTLCRNTGAELLPDLWLWEVSDWVCFPWELPAAEPAVPLPVLSQPRSQP
jgi:hypoxanthine phosphoribosyltransferase